MLIRKPCVSGTFYPASKEGLMKELEKFVTEPGKKEKEVFGAISPHAGYMYSGRVAGVVFSNIKIPNRVVILNPNHRGIGPDVSVFPEGRWEFPGFSVDIDEEIVSYLSQNPLFVKNSSAHEEEHSGEVQVPFIWFKNRTTRFAFITIRTLKKNILQDVGMYLSKLKRDFPEIIFVSSSDMNHYEPDDISREKDKKAIDKILSLDAEGLLSTVLNHNISMCGIAPVASLLFAAKDYGVKSAELVAYTNSGEVSGDKSAVVGYAGFILL